MVKDKNTYAFIDRTLEKMSYLNHYSFPIISSVTFIAFFYYVYSFQMLCEMLHIFIRCCRIFHNALQLTDQ